MTPILSLDHRRRIGALAGLAPALAATIVLVILGASPTGDALPWFAGIVVVAAGSGWVIGPRVLGSFPADLRAAVAFAVAGTIAYVLVGSAMSVWSGPAVDDGDVPGIAGRVAGQLAYGLLYSPFLVGLLTPFGLGWMVAVRWLRRITGVAAPDPRDDVAGGRRIGASVDPRRMGLFAALLIVAFGAFVAALPLLIYAEPRSPWWMYRPAALVVLFSVPAWIGAIGTIRRRPTLLVAAGVICVAQAYVSFSLVTIGFLVPGLVLLVLAAGGRSPDATPEPRRAYAASAAVVVLTVAAWVATLGMTEEVCWTSTANPDGSLTYERLPVSDVMTVRPGAAASGCDGGTLTAEGMGVGAVLAIGAVAMAAGSTWSRRTAVPV